MRPQAAAGGDMVSAGLGCAVLPGLSPRSTGVHLGARGSAQPLCSMAAGIHRLTKTWLLVCSSAHARADPLPCGDSQRVLGRAFASTWGRERELLWGWVPGCSGSFPGSLSSSLPRSTDLNSMTFRSPRVQASPHIAQLSRKNPK